MKNIGPHALPNTHLLPLHTSGEKCVANLKELKNTSTKFSIQLLKPQKSKNWLAG